MVSRARSFCVSVAVALSVGVLGGCGYSRTPVPNPAGPVTPKGFSVLQFSKGAIALGAPGNWVMIPGHAPHLLSTVSSGPAVISLWRFPRTGPPPPALSLALAHLLAAARAKDPTLQVIRTGEAPVGGRPALELDVLARVGGQLRRIRSTHVFAARAEIVLDEIAPPSIFHRIDHLVFSPVAKTLRVRATA